MNPPVITLASDNASPMRGGKRRQGYDNGFRLGTFDRCNGREARTFDNVPLTKYNDAYVDGYIDGYVTNGARL